MCVCVSKDKDAVSGRGSHARALLPKLAFYCVCMYLCVCAILSLLKENIYIMNIKSEILYRDECGRSLMGKYDYFVCTKSREENLSLLDPFMNSLIYKVHINAAGGMCTVWSPKINRSIYRPENFATVNIEKFTCIIHWNHPRTLTRSGWTTNTLTHTHTYTCATIYKLPTKARNACSFKSKLINISLFLSILQRAKQWQRHTIVNSLKHQWASIITWTSCSSVCCRKYDWNWKIRKNQGRLTLYNIINQDAHGNWVCIVPTCARLNLFISYFILFTYRKSNRFFIVILFIVWPQGFV